MNTGKSLTTILIIFILTLQPSFAKNYNDSDAEKRLQPDQNPHKIHNSFEQAYFTNVKVDLKDFKQKLKKSLPEEAGLIEIINNSISKKALIKENQ